MSIITVLFLLIIVGNVQAEVVGPAGVKFYCSCSQGGGEECGYDNDGSGEVKRDKGGVRQRQCCMPQTGEDGSEVKTYCAYKGTKTSPGVCCPEGQSAGISQKCEGDSSASSASGGGSASDTESVSNPISNNNQEGNNDQTEKQQYECDPIVQCCGSSGKRKSELTGDECCVQTDDGYAWASTPEECCEGKKQSCQKCEEGNPTPVAECTSDSDCKEGQECDDSGCCQDKCKDSTVCEEDGDCESEQKCGEDGCCVPLCDAGQTICQDDSDCDNGGPTKMTCSKGTGDKGCCMPLCPAGYVYCDENGCDAPGESSSGSGSPGGG